MMAIKYVIVNMDNLSCISTKLGEQLETDCSV